MMCKHSWLADSPKGLQTRVVCKRCLVVDYKPSSIPDEKLRKIELTKEVNHVGKDCSE